MPGGDRTGPMGMGSMSGRAAGYCARSDMPGYVNSAPGRAFGTVFGRGRGFRGAGAGGGGRGWRCGFSATDQPGWGRFGGYGAPYGYPAPYPKPDPELEQQALKHRAKALQSELGLIQNRLSEIETETVAE